MNDDLPRDNKHFHPPPLGLPQWLVGFRTTAPSLSSRSAKANEPSRQAGWGFRPHATHGIAVVLSVSLLPWLLAADSPAPPQREANRQRLDEMTVAERQQLDENVRVYREMTPAERDRLRNLQREIESDRELKAAFDEYQRWADSLSPVDRHELRQTQDPEARRQLIDRLRHRPPHGEMFEPGPADRPPNGPPFGQNNAKPRMTERLFGGLTLPMGDRLGSGVPEMEAIVRVLEQELPAETHDELGKLDAYSRTVRVLRLTLEKRPLGSPVVRLFGSGSQTIEKIIAALPDGPVRQLPVIRTFNPAPNQPDPRGGLLVMVLVRGLMTETSRTMEDHRPRQEMMTAFQEKLPAAEKARLNKLSREEHQQELLTLYVKDHVPAIAELQQILGTSEMDHFLRDMSNRFRPGVGPPEGDDRRDKKGRLPPFDGSRPPRDSDSLPPRPPR